MREFSLIIPPELDGAKVRDALRRGLGMSVTRIRRAIFREDGSELDGVRVFTGATVHTGQRLVMRLPEREGCELLPTPGEVEILYEDDWLIAVNKPPGMPVHPGPGHYADSLGNYLTYMFHQRGEHLVLHPVNRLDLGTSGVMLLARWADSHERLQQLLHTPDFVREYLAVTRNTPNPPCGTVDAPIGPVEGTLNRHCIREDGRHAVTHYETLASRDDTSLLRLRLETGRTHQIRVHMAHIGHPLLGDSFYGGDACFPRPALHAYRIILRHPYTNALLQLTAPIPRDFAALGWEVLP